MAFKTYKDWLAELDAETSGLIQAAAEQQGIDPHQALSYAYARQKTQKSADGSVGVFGLTPQELEAQGFDSSDPVTSITAGVAKIKKLNETFKDQPAKIPEAFITSIESARASSVGKPPRPEVADFVKTVDATPRTTGDSGNSVGVPQSEMPAQNPVNPFQAQLDAIEAAGVKANSVIRGLDGQGAAAADKLKTTAVDFGAVAANKKQILADANVTSRSKLAKGVGELSAIDREKLDIAKRVIGASDPLNPKSSLAVNRQRAEELNARVAETTRAAEYTADATIFSDPATYIDKMFNGNRYASGSRELNGLIADVTSGDKALTSDIQAQIKLAGSSRLKNRADVTYATTTGINVENAASNRDLKASDLEVQAQARRAEALASDINLRKADLGTATTELSVAGTLGNAARAGQSDTATASSGVANPVVAETLKLQQGIALQNAKDVADQQQQGTYVAPARVAQQELQQKSIELQGLQASNPTPVIQQRIGELKQEIALKQVEVEAYNTRVASGVAEAVPESQTVAAQVALKALEAKTAAFNNDNFKTTKKLTQTQQAANLAQANSILATLPAEEQLKIQQLENGTDKQRKEASERKQALVGWQRAGRAGTPPSVVLDYPEVRAKYVQFGQGDTIGSTPAQNVVELVDMGLTPENAAEASMLKDLQHQITRIAKVEFQTDKRFKAVAGGISEAQLTDTLASGKLTGLSSEATIFGGSKVYNLVDVTTAVEYGKTTDKFSASTLEILDSVADKLKNVKTAKQLVETLVNPGVLDAPINLAPTGLSYISGTVPARITPEDAKNVTLALHEVLKATFDSTNTLKNFSKWGIKTLDPADTNILIEGLFFTDTTVDITSPAGAQLLLKEYTLGGTK